MKANTNSKCDTCYYSTGYVLGSDEVGAGNPCFYCAKDHWVDMGDYQEDNESYNTHWELFYPELKKL